MIKIKKANYIVTVLIGYQFEIAKMFRYLCRDANGNHLPLVEMNLEGSYNSHWVKKSQALVSHLESKWVIAFVSMKKVKLVISAAHKPKICFPVGNFGKLVVFHLDNTHNLGNISSPMTEKINQAHLNSHSEI